MSRNDRQLLQRLGSARDFLSQQVEHKPLYENLICTLDRLANRLQNDSKPLIKIVSPSSSLAENLRAKHEANAELRSLYEFESISPIGQIFPILEDCDLMCLVYEPRREIREHHYNLIRLAKKQDIDLLILVQSQPDIDEADYSRWQRDLDAIAERMLPIACNYFIDFSDTAELELCQRSLIDLATAIASNRQARIASEIIREVKRFFTLETASLWQTVKQINSQYFQDRPLYIFQQQLRQDTQTLNQFRQQLIRDIKQAVNHEKTDLLNPFAVEGLIFSFQQLINSAEVKIVAERDNTYLYLVLAQFPQQPLLHDYILELCQQRVDRILAQQWSNINSVYGGGLELLVERSNRELSKIESLLDYEPKLTPLSQLEQPSLKIDRVIDPYCLKINSRIPFDYSFTQSSWFRLFVSALIGTAIYLSTWLYLGTGKYIGFMIIIFQLINLMTGQSIKKARLKQQSKELKRIADQKYQSVVRTIINYLTQNLTVAIDRECQLYQQEYGQAIADAQNKLDELKQSNEEQKAKIEAYNRDRDKIIAWFE